MLINYYLNANLYGNFFSVVENAALYVKADRKQLSPLHSEEKGKKFQLKRKFTRNRLDSRLPEIDWKQRDVVDLTFYIL